MREKRKIIKVKLVKFEGEHILCSKGNKLNAKQALWMKSWGRFLKNMIAWEFIALESFKASWRQNIPTGFLGSVSLCSLSSLQSFCISSMLAFIQSSTLFSLFSLVSFPFLHLFPTSPLNHQVKMSLYKSHWDAIMFTSDLFLMKEAFLFPGATPSI